MSKLILPPIKILLCLSGGGFRATLFHLGVLKRIQQLGLWDNIETISSSSGGSILNALVGVHYDNIKTENDFNTYIYNPIVALVTEGVRTQILKSTILSLVTFSPNKLKSLGHFEAILDQQLLNGKTLSDLSKNVRVVINATNLVNGARWRFDNNDFGDYKTGYSYETKFIKLSTAVAASAAFPLVFSPLQLVTGDYKFIKRDKSKKDLDHNKDVPNPILLTDAGVYDNLGINSALYEAKNSENNFIVVSEAPTVFNEGFKNSNILASIARCFEIAYEQKEGRNRQEIYKRLTENNPPGVYFTLTRSCRYYREFTTEELQIPTQPTDLPADIGLHDSEVALIGKVRTDLDSFNQLEIDYLTYHGSSLFDLNLRKWHPTIYAQLQDTPLRKPEYASQCPVPKSLNSQIS